MIKLKRVYEKPSKQDGTRILVERLWPHGLSKRVASVDLWVRDVAPSTKLRKWFNHVPDRWNEFRKRYRAELKLQSSLVTLLDYVSRNEKVTFVFAASDPEINSAVVLKEYLEHM